LTLEFSSNVIGNSSMVTWRKQFLPMLLHWGERMLTYIYSSTLTMLVTSWCNDCMWDSWYISTWHRLFGIQRSAAKQSTRIKTSMCGAEFVAMKQGMEALQGLWYKLWMMGIQINGPSYIYGDNMFVIHNTQWPESTLKKKQVQLSVLPWGTWVSCYYGWIPN
jgi:hypothetical protein